MMEGPDEFIGPVNLGNPDEFTIRELAELAIELTDSRSEIAHKPLPEDDPKQPRPADFAVGIDHRCSRPEIDLRFFAGCRLQASLGQWHVLLQFGDESPHTVIASGKSILLPQVLINPPRREALF